MESRDSILFCFVEANKYIEAIVRTIKEGSELYIPMSSFNDYLPIEKMSVVKDLQNIPFRNSYICITKQSLGVEARGEAKVVFIQGQGT